MIKRHKNKVLCEHCGNWAAGTFWAKYHYISAILSCEPVCPKHMEELAADNQEGREVGFIPNLTTKNVRIVEQHLGIR